MTLVEGEVYFQRSEKLVPFKPAAEAPSKPAVVSFPKFKPDGPILLRNVTLHNPGKSPIVADIRILKGKIDKIGVSQSDCLGLSQIAGSRTRPEAPFGATRSIPSVGMFWSARSAPFAYLGRTRIGRYGAREGRTPVGAAHHAHL